MKAILSGRNIILIEMPDLYIITGSNGAGKSTTGNNYLPDHIRKKCEIFDGDKLFMQKQKALWSQGITAIKEARKIAYQYVTDLFDERVNRSLEFNTDFVYEGHFTNESTWDIPKRFKENKYGIHLIYLGLENVALSESRVSERVTHGGHYVQPSEIAANFYGNLEKLNKYYILFDTVIIVDASEPEHKILVYLKDRKIISSSSVSELPDWFTTHLSNITRSILKS